MDSIMGTKKKKKETASSEKKKLIQVRIEVAKPGSKKYTHVDWEELLRKQGVEKDEETLRRFYDEDTLFMAKKLGETRSKSGKQLRVNLDHIQYLNRNCGYDMDDEFIDDTEAVDDVTSSGKKGRFYVGKGEVKNIDEEEEEEEEIEEDTDTDPTEKTEKSNKKPRKKRPDESESSGSDSEPVRMTGAPPTARMAGGPPTKNRALTVKRPSPPVVVEKIEKIDKIDKTVKKTVPEVITIESGDSEPPVKKSRPETIEATPISASPQKVVTTGVKKKVDEPKPSTSTTTTTSPVASETNVTAVVTRLFQSVVLKLTAAKAKSSKLVAAETIQQINELLNISKNHTGHKAKFLETFAGNLGVTVEEFQKILNKEEAEPELKLSSSESSEWKLLPSDIPHFSAADLESLSTILKTWRNLKHFSPLTYATWLRDVNAGKLSLDAARVKLYSIVSSLADKEKEKGNNEVELPKHERSRKARQFLPQWVYLSRKYVDMLLPTLKNPSTDGYAQKQMAAINALKDAVKKQITSFETKKDKTTDAVYQLQFNDPVLASIWTYIDELIDYSLAHRCLDVLVKGIDNLHYQCLDKRVTLIQFYIELCRRFQKLSFLTVEEPLKGRLASANEQIVKYQVVQNVKYMIKWPGGVEPSIRGFNRELSLSDFETSIFSTPKKTTIAASPAKIAPKQFDLPQKSIPSVSKPSTSKPVVAPLAPRQPTEEERRTMNQIVQVYLVKYLLANGQTTADICDPNVAPMTDEMAGTIINAIAQIGVAQINQIVMVKNLLSHTGQIRMTQLLNKTKTPPPLLTLKDYQNIFEYFQSYEKLAEQKRAKLKEAEEKEKRKQEEKVKKEQEKQAEKERERMRKEEEKERKEKEKAEEKERKEKEKREERERKEREAAEERERRRMEEEERRKAMERMRLKAEDERRKREAQEMVEKELERRAKMETEAANALQFLEEDLLMDDVDFVSEQQIREEQERKIAEAKRAEERENQIKMMRAKQVKREEEEVPMSSEQHNLAQNMAQNAPNMVQNGYNHNPPSEPTFSNYSAPPPPTQNVDILNVAQQVAGLQPKKEPSSPQTPSAFDQLARLRGRTMSADVKRGQAQQLPVQNVQQYSNNHNNAGQNNAPFCVPSTSSPLHHQKFFPQSPISTNPMMMSQQTHQNPMGMLQQQQSTMSNNYYGSNGQRPPIPASYQSPSSSMMHTPMSSDFSASPMSQPFHTPPSVGMMPAMSPQNAHFGANNTMSMSQNNPNMVGGYQMHQQQQQSQGGFQRMHNNPQMHRQMSQQQMQMQQLQQQQMMRHQQHHQFPPGSH